MANHRKANAVIETHKAMPKSLPPKP